MLSFKCIWTSHYWTVGQLCLHNIPYKHAFALHKLYNTYGCDFWLGLNSSPPSDAYMHQWIKSALVQIMTCRLFSAKPLSNYSAPSHYLTRAGLLLIGPLGTNFSKTWIKIRSFSFTKMHLKLSSAKMAAMLSRGRWVKTAKLPSATTIKGNVVWCCRMRWAAPGYMFTHWGRVTHISVKCWMVYDISIFFFLLMFAYHCTKLCSKNCSLPNIGMYIIGAMHIHNETLSLNSCNYFIN